MDEIQELKSEIFGNAAPALRLIGELQEYTGLIKKDNFLPDALASGVEALIQNIYDLTEDL